MYKLTKSKFYLFWEKHFIAFDTLSAFVYSSFLYTLLLCYYPKSLEGLCDKDFLLAFITTYVSLCGFLITALAILISFQDGDKVKIFRQRNTFKEVFNIFGDALFWLCVLIVMGVVLLAQVLSAKNSVGPCLIPQYLLFGVTLTIFKVRRAIWILKVMFNFSLESSKE